MKKIKMLLFKLLGIKERPEVLKKYVKAVKGGKKKLAGKLLVTIIHDYCFSGIADTWDSDKVQSRLWLDFELAVHKRAISFALKKLYVQGYGYLISEPFKKRLKLGETLTQPEHVELDKALHELKKRAGEFGEECKAKGIAPILHPVVAKAVEELAKGAKKISEPIHNLNASCDVTPQTQGDNEQG